MSSSRSQSGCDISIDVPKPGSSERIITIVGSSSDIQRAQQLLQKRYDIFVGTLIFDHVDLCPPPMTVYETSTQMFDHVTTTLYQLTLVENVKLLEFSFFSYNYLHGFVPEHASHTSHNCQVVWT